MPIRDIVIITIVIALAALSLRRPWIGVMNWTWLSIMNPHRYAWGFAYSFPVAAIAAGATLIGLLFTKERQSPFKGAPVRWLAIFVVWMTISWLLGYDPKGDYALWNKVIKIYLMTFVALALLSTKQHIMIFTWVTIGSITLLAAKGGLFTLLTGGEHRVWGPTDSFIQGNNEFALATIMTIPMLHFLKLQLHEPWQRHAMTAAMMLSAVAAIGSYSRGALLAIAAMSLVYWWRSSRKGLVGAIILVGAIAMLPLMPQEWWDRMDTIQTFEQDASALGRINAWAVAISVAKTNITGAGMDYLYPELFLRYSVNNSKPLAAHSIYFQILGNHGFLGLVLFIGIWVSTFRLAGRLRTTARDDPDIRWVSDLGGMIQSSLVAYAVGGAFLSLAYFDLPINLMIVSVLASVWVKQHGAVENPQLKSSRKIAAKGERVSADSQSVKSGGPSASWIERPAGTGSHSTGAQDQT